ncbi:hypothetical protein LCGC14_0741740 [marine sediment metagenome]|uniref:HTH arsR-type domain-containing protein n=1 Tax=marine sediment metagenome TaxID=412755 RepID=A0A0F9Q6H0_9ZZZZ
MEETKKVRLTINNEPNGLNTKLFIIQRLIKMKEPVSMYKLAKDLHMSTSKVFYHFNTLIDSGVIILYKNKYQINPCFKYPNDILELLMPFFECIRELNSDLDGDQLLNFTNYFLATISLEVESED